MTFRNFLQIIYYLKISYIIIKRFKIKSKIQDYNSCREIRKEYSKKVKEGLTGMITKDNTSQSPEENIKVLTKPNIFQMRIIFTSISWTSILRMMVFLMK